MTSDYIIDDLQQFLTQNETQLKRLPESLHVQLFMKIQNQEFGSQGLFEKSSHTIYSKKYIPAIQNVFLYPHIWTFESSVQACQHLQENQSLQVLISSYLADLLIFHSHDFNLETMEEKIINADNPIEKIMSGMSLCAFQYQTLDLSGELKTFYYTCMQEDDPNYFKVNLDPHLDFFIFFDQLTSKVYTVAYNRKELKEEEEVTRSELIPFPDFKWPDFWEYFQLQMPLVFSSCPISTTEFQSLMPSLNLNGMGLDIGTQLGTSLVQLGQMKGIFGLKHLKSLNEKVPYILDSGVFQILLTICGKEWIRHFFMFLCNWMNQESRLISITKNVELILLLEEELKLEIQNILELEKENEKIYLVTAKLKEI